MGNSNILEFFIKMRDLASSGLAKFSANAQAAYARVQNGIDKTILKNKSLGDSFDHVNSKATRSGMGIGGFIAKIGLLTAATAVLTAGISFAGNSVGKAMEFGSTKKSFEVLTGSPERGNQLANDLNKLQQDTILGPGVFKNAQTMMGFGIAADKVIPILKMLGDVSMGNEEKLGALTLAFSQVQAAGRLTGQDLLQFINAGFNPLNEISKMTGKSIGQLKKEMEDGAISSDMVAKAFERATAEGGLYNNMLNKLAETPAGKMAQLQGQWESFQVQLGETLMPLAMMAMQFAQPLLELAQSTLPQITAFISGLLTPSVEWGFWIDLVKQQVFIIWDGLQHVFAVVWKVISGVVNWVKQSELMRDLATGIQLVFEGLWWVIKKIGDLLGWIWDNVFKPILDGIETAYKFMKAIFGFSGKETTLTNQVNMQVETKTPGATGGTNSLGAIAANNVKTNIPVSAAGSPKTSGGEVAKGITGGGPRVVNINGVKFTDKVELHSTTMEAGIDDMMKLMEQYFLRLLNSGAQLQ